MSGMIEQPECPLTLWGRAGDRRRPDTGHTKQGLQ